MQNNQYIGNNPYRQPQRYQPEYTRPRQYEVNGCHDQSRKQPDNMQTPSTSSLSGVQSLQQGSTSRPNSQEQIQLQPLHVRPDSPSLVKVKSWYTMSKRDVC